jgi:hypothetical protein
MPTRINKIRHDENTRLKIKVGNIITCLQKHLFEGSKLSPTQLKAAEILLRKSLPDMTSVEHSGEIITSKVIRAPELSDTNEEWLDRHVPQHLRSNGNATH